MGDRDTFLVALVERGQGVFAGRVDAVEVSFHAGGKELGRARTDRNGYAVAIGRIPLGVDTIEARAGLAGLALTSQARVLTWKPDRTIIVCDIDGTVSDTDVHTLLHDQRDTGSRPLPRAAQTLQSLSGRYNLCFLTGRPVFLYTKTYEWLKDNTFPEAPVILAPNLRDAKDVESFKQRTIAMAKRLYPDALIGIGNAETDSQAYTAEGMLAIMIDDGKNRRFRSEAIALQTWNRVRQFFDANHDLLTDPSRLRSFLEAGGLLQYPQPPLQANR